MQSSLFAVGNRLQPFVEDEEDRVSAMGRPIVDLRVLRRSARGCVAKMVASVGP